MSALVTEKSVPRPTRSPITWRKVHREACSLARHVPRLPYICYNSKRSRCNFIHNGSRSIEEHLALRRRCSESSRLYCQPPET